MPVPTPRTIQPTDAESCTPGLDIDQTQQPQERSFSNFPSIVHLSLVTQPMMQGQPNPTELRSMDSYIQILCRFQKSKPKVSPPSLPCTKKSPPKG